MRLRRLKRIRWAVRAVLALGVAASTTANILHAEPNPISQSIAAWPPIALLLTVELIGRVPVHRRSLALARWTATAVIAGIAAWVSYWHMAELAARYGERGASPFLLPLSVDGLVVVASVCLVELAGQIRDVEIAPVPAPAEPATLTPAEPPADAKPAVTRTRPRSLTSAEKIAKIAAKMPTATAAQIAAKAGVSESTARRYLPADLASPSDPDAAQTSVNGHRPNVEVPV